VQDAFAIVLVVVLVGAVIAAIWASIGTGEAYRQIGRGGLSLNDGSDRPGGDGRASPAVAAGEREAEIRQMLEARNARRAARGEELSDVEAELAALLGAPAFVADPALEAEIRDLAIARNERRARQGKPPLDVEAEVARSLAELHGDP
jgi:hypothetical protein